MPVLPTVSFKEFVKNPIVALLFLCLTAIGTLYYQNVTTLGNQIKDLQSEITQLKKDYKELNNKFIQTIEQASNKTN